MDIEEFANSPVGTLVPLKGHDGRLQQDYDYWAFLPHPLPYELVLSNETHNLVAKASREIGRLQTAIETFPNPAILQSTSLVREAQSTSALEGTYAPLEAVFESEFLPNLEMSSEQREISNYLKAARVGLDFIESAPIRNNLLSDLQSIIVENTRGGQSDRGRVRTSPVIIGDEGKPVEKSRFIPPPAGFELEAGYRAWEEWLNHSHTFSALVTIALAHYQFETLHPYYDGNGRLGRLVISMQLKKFRLLTPPVLNLSAYFNARKESYKDELLAVSKRGDFDRWIQYFSEAIIVQCNSEILRIKKLQEFIKTMEDQIRESESRGLILEIPKTLLETPYFTISSLSKKLGNTYPAVKAAVDRMVTSGHLQELKLKGDRKIYVAFKILHILREDSLT